VVIFSGRISAWAGKTQPHYGSWGLGAHDFGRSHYIQEGAMAGSRGPYGGIAQLAECQIQNLKTWVRPLVPQRWPGRSWSVNKQTKMKKLGLVALLVAFIAASCTTDRSSCHMAKGFVGYGPGGYGNGIMQQH
jgi:hypothetical protein